MEAKDRSRIQQQILEAYPGTDPEIDVDWEIGEIFFKAGQREVVEWLRDAIVMRQVEKGTIYFRADKETILFESGYNEWQEKLKEIE